MHMVVVKSSDIHTYACGTRVVFAFFLADESTRAAGVVLQQLNDTVEQWLENYHSVSNANEISGECSSGDSEMMVNAFISITEVMVEWSKGPRLSLFHAY